MFDYREQPYHPQNYQPLLMNILQVCLKLKNYKDT